MLRLCKLRRPTFFTLDWDYYRPDLCHTRYCLVYLSVSREESALFVRRLLGHPQFGTQAKRMGAVIRAAYSGLHVWRLGTQAEVTPNWQ